MARSRLVKIGTIHSRTTGLLRAGAMKEEERPLWLDIYEAFPPKDEPRYDRPAPKTSIRDIFYEEDVIRAKYHNDHRNLPSIRLDTSERTQTQKFIATYRKLEKDGVAEPKLYAAAVSQMSTKPVGSKHESLEETKEGPPPTGTRDPKQQSINLDLSNIFKE